MSDPTKPDFQAVSERMAGTFARMQSWQQSAEGVAFAARASSIEADRERALRIRLADDRETPGNPQVRAVSLLRSPENRPAIQSVRTVLAWRHFGDVLRSLAFVLVGTPGNGKTSALAWAVTWHERPALYTLARVVGATINNGYSDNTAALKRWSKCDLLAIDELGHEESPEHSARIAALIAERYDAGRVTLCAGNVSSAWFAERYGNERLISRLRNEQYKHGLGGGVSVRGRDSSA